MVSPGVLRAALDLGSGATKLCVGRVFAGGRVEVVHAEEAEVLLGHSHKAAPDGTIDAATADKLHAVLARFRRIIDAAGTGVPAVGVATAVYRAAPNGPKLLAECCRRHGIVAQVLPQDSEAVLGFRTGVALRVATGERPRCLVVWDSGGASFQLSAERGGAPVQLVGGRWGSSSALFALREHLGRPHCHSPHPYPAGCFDTFVEHLQDAIQRQTDPAAAEAVREELSGGGELVAIGGPTNAFRCAVVLSGERTVSRDTLLQLGRDLCQRADSDIARRGVPQPEMATAKLALVAAVMGALRLPPFTFFQSTGVCQGLLVSEAFWPAASRL